MDKQIADSLAELRLSSRVSLGLIVVAALLLLGSVVYSATRLSPLERQLAEKQIALTKAHQEIQKATTTKRALDQSVDALHKEVANLRTTQESLLDFLARVTDREQVSILDPSVDWDAVKADILAMPNGRRKQAVLSAILLAWKALPFSMGRESLATGFDSPRFIRYVLRQNGLNIQDRPGEPLSATIMNSFHQVDDPRPGDLVFYRGQVGSFGLIYLSKGGAQGRGVGVGTLQAAAPLQIISLHNINTPFYPLIGYFRVQYPDERGER